MNDASSPREALIAAVNLGGDADTVGAVTGQLAGARFGYSAFPASWRQALVWREHIETTADRLIPRASRFPLRPGRAPHQPHIDSKTLQGGAEAAAFAEGQVKGSSMPPLSRLTDPDRDIRTALDYATQFGFGPLTDSGLGVRVVDPALLAHGAPGVLGPTNRVSGAFEGPGTARTIQNVTGERPFGPPLGWTSPSATMSLVELPIEFDPMRVEASGRPVPPPTSAHSPATTSAASEAVEVGSPDRIERAFEGLPGQSARASTIQDAAGHPAFVSPPGWTSLPSTGTPWSPAPLEVDLDRQEGIAAPSTAARTPGRQARPGVGPGLGAGIDEHGRIFGTQGSDQTTYGLPIPGELRFRPGGLDRAGNPLTDIITRSGARLRIANPYVERFAGFINELEARGYLIRPGDTAGYVPRNTASGRPSEHARGYAGDFNWQANPESGRRFGPVRTTLPRDIDEMARRWGLRWGGNWHTRDRGADPMHVEVDRHFRGDIPSRRGPR